MESEKKQREGKRKGEEDNEINHRQINKYFSNIEDTLHSECNKPLWNQYMGDLYPSLFRLRHRSKRV